MEKRLRTLLVACSLTGSILTGSILTGSILTGSSPTADSAEDKKSYVWQNLEKQLDIPRVFTSLSQSIQTANSADPSLITERCRMLINNCTRLIDPSDPQLAELIVASCAYSNQSNAIDLMEQVLNPRQNYSSASWLAAMQYLSSQPSSRACDLLIRCMGLPYLEINMASAYFLSQNSYARSSPDTIERILAIQRRIDRRSWVWIADFLVRFDHPQATQAIRQIYFESDVETQAAILQIVSESPLPFDDLIASALTSSSPLLLESVLYYALLHSSGQAPWLASCLELTSSRYERVVTTALILKIHTTSDASALEELRLRIRKGDLHAIAGCGLLARIHTEGLPSGLQAALIEGLDSLDGKVQLQASMALLEALNPAGLDLLADIFNDNSLLLTTQPLASASWPIYQVQWISSSKDPTYPYSLAKQYQGRNWLLEKASRLPIDKLVQWYEKLVGADEGSSHYLVTTHLSSLPSPQTLELLQKWKEAPGKPWLRLGSHLSLWRINRDPESLERLQDWMGRPGDSMIPFLTSTPQTGPMKLAAAWVGDFQTQVLLEIAGELSQNGDARSWQKICSRLSEQPHPLEMLPLVALLSKRL